MCLNLRISVAAFSFVFGGLLVCSSIALGASDRPKPDHVVLVKAGDGMSGRALVNRLSSSGLEVLESYDTFALVSLPSGQKPAIERGRLLIEELPDRTMTGRGAYVFDTRSGEPAVPEALRIDTRKEPDYDIHIIQFIGPVKSKWVEAVRSAGAEIFGYLPSYSYIAALPRGAVERTLRLPFVQWVGLYHPAYKINPDLLSTADETTAISLSLFPQRTLDRVSKAITTAGGSVFEQWQSGGEWWLRASVPTPMIVDLARLPEVAWMEKYLPASLANDQATWVVQSNVQNVRTIFDKGLHGEGQLVTMTDEGIDLKHPMFMDASMLIDHQEPGDHHRKVQSCTAVVFPPPNLTSCATGACQGQTSPPSLEGHGNFTAGVIAGDAPVTGTYDGHDGHAYMSRLIVQDIGPRAAVNCVPEDIRGTLFDPSFSQGSRLHTNSWGSPNAAHYCSRAVASDLYMWDHPDYFIDFAAGNEGYNGIRCEATAKDVVTVGGSKNGTLADDTYAKTSRGPAGTDGRRKPTLMAPGEDICSAKIPYGHNPVCPNEPDTTNYTQWGGTSFAAPALAGSAALVRQYFTDGYHPTGAQNDLSRMTPSAALLKAVLINGADEMTGAGAWAESSIKTSTTHFRSAPSALRAIRTLSSRYAARATTASILLDYTSTYLLDLYFFVPTEANVGEMLIADDGRVFAHLIPSGPTGISLEVLGGNGSGQGSVNRNHWYHLKITYNPPLGTFQTNLDTQNLGTFTFAGDYLSTLSLGTDDLAPLPPTFYGEVYFDDICYSQLGAQSTDEVWCDHDGDLALWTVTPSHDEESGYPNNIQGWGRINLDNSLYFNGDTRRLLACDDRAGLITGFQRSTKVQVTDTTQPLEVTLAWSDRPAALNSEHALVNNLDLVVTDPNNVVYRGNCFQGRNKGQSVSVASNPSCAADSVNVEEEVLVLPDPAHAQPTTGVWTIAVNGQNVDPSDNKPQPFALAITGAVVSPPPDVTLTAASDYLTNPGQLIGGYFPDTWTSNNVWEGIQEQYSSGAYHLTQIWRFSNLPCRTSYKLHLEGHRSAGTGMDSFQFSWAPEVNGAPGTFQNIPNATIIYQYEVTGGADYPFTAPGASGNLYIRVQDMEVGANPTTVYIDHLTVR